MTEPHDLRTRATGARVSRAAPATWLRSSSVKLLPSALWLVTAFITATTVSCGGGSELPAQNARSAVETSPAEQVTGARSDRREGTVSPAAAVVTIELSYTGPSFDISLCRATYGP